MLAGEKSVDSLQGQFYTLTGRQAEILTEVGEEKTGGERRGMAPVHIYVCVCVYVCGFH